MNLVIDIGNSRIKLCVFKDCEIVHNVTSENLPTSEISQLARSFNISRTIISTVVTLPQEWVHFAADALEAAPLYLDHQLPVPIQNLYKTPRTLGLDRLAAAVGSATIFPRANTLVVDAGTAITIDFINDSDQFLGGNISPGIAMRYKALNHFTSKLPLLGLKDDFAPLGRDTDSAITAGVQQGALNEIDQYIEHAGRQYPNLKVLFTGGDAFFFEKNLKNTIFVEPFLVLKGLNRILNYNAFKD